MTSKTQFSSQRKGQTRQIKHIQSPENTAMECPWQWQTHTHKKEECHSLIFCMSRNQPCLPFKRDTDRITRSHRTHLQQTLTTQNLQIANCSCRQATHKRPACLTNMIGGRRTLQTYIATIKHHYLLFEDSIVSLSRRENTMTTD